MNKEYWEKIYKENKLIKEASNFAIFCYENYISKTNCTELIDIGCGNFRDTLYFIKNGVKCTSVDQIHQNLPSEKINYIKSEIQKLDILNAHFFYMRWLIHALNENEERELFDWLEKSSEVGNYVFIECRSNKDKNILGDKHYRRLINKDDLKNKILKLNFDLIYFEENNGFSKMGIDDPILIRLVAIKK